MSTSVACMSDPPGLKNRELVGHRGLWDAQHQTGSRIEPLHGESTARIARLPERGSTARNETHENDSNSPHRGRVGI